METQRMRKARAVIFNLIGGIVIAMIVVVALINLGFVRH